MNKSILLLLSLIVCLCFSSCSNEEKFNREAWLGADSVNPEREQMVNDLLKNYKVMGASHKEILKLLGEPEYDDNTGMSYPLSTKYDVIDPVSGKRLILTFNKDSIVTKAKVEDWKKP